MLTITPKVELKDTNIIHVYIGNHGFPINLDRLKNMVDKNREEMVTQEEVYYLCKNKLNEEASKKNKPVKDLSSLEIKQAIETIGEI